MSKKNNLLYFNFATFNWNSFYSRINSLEFTVGITYFIRLYFMKNSKLIPISIIPFTILNSEDKDNNIVNLYISIYNNIFYFDSNLIFIKDNPKYNNNDKQFAIRICKGWLDI